MNIPSRGLSGKKKKKKTKINKTENTLDWYSPSDEKMALMGLEEVATTH